MLALDHAVWQGKALYVGISNYSPQDTARAAEILIELGTPCLIHQPAFSMLNRWVEDGLLDTLEEKGLGCIAFSPLAQGLLSDKYLSGIPEDSRAAKEHGFLKKESITKVLLKKNPRAQQTRKRTQSNPRANGHRLAAQRQTHHLRANRRQQQKAN